MSFLLETAIKISLVTGLGLLAVLLLRRGSAALRHWMLQPRCWRHWRLPCSPVLRPHGAFRWPPPTDPAQDADAHAGYCRQSRLARSGEHDAAGRSRAIRSIANHRQHVPILAIWLAGVAINLSGLLLGFWRLRRVAARAAAVHDGPWVERARTLAARFSLRRPVRSCRAINQRCS